MDKSMRILVVDDDPTMRQIVIRLFKSLKYDNVEGAENGTAALDMLRNGSFDFLATDWDMPGVKGIELLRSVRADNNLKNLPVLMMTGVSKKAEIIEAAQAGASGYVVKPFTAEVLDDKVNKILKELNL
ncbi:MULTISPECIES: response regulator [Pseudomonas]|uniref:response regulator n=1 Tax=Pseudomonas TaxID=286 RepID=UPI000CD4EB7E|nr:response regulator [Pseudomonas sp. MWU12-2020]RBB99859.1 response regulator [Pseudomonas sp. MWU12-2115]RBL72089.1 response regulator [Pseudomonas sp. MWU13-2625]